MDALFPLFIQTKILALGMDLPLQGRSSDKPLWKTLIDTPRVSAPGDPKSSQADKD